MIKIGIVGDFYKTSSLICKIYELKGYKVNVLEKLEYILLDNLNNEKNKEILIVNLTGCNNFIFFDILIINKPLFIYSQDYKTSFNLSRKSVILLDADNICNTKISTYNNPHIITYGFNSKSTITFSSIIGYLNNQIQYCIQRAIPTLSGNIIEEQEFKINSSVDNVSIVLASVTAAIINDVDIESIKSAII